MAVPGDTAAPPRNPSPGAAVPTLRRTGIDVVGDAPWGTHFCQFYATPDDLKDILVPYFKAGLEADELCMWVTSPPLGVAEAWEALARAVPDLEAHRRRGRIEILPHTDWYLLGGAFDQERVLAGWVRKLEVGLSQGFTGLRLSGNTFWLEKGDWRNFAEYEAEIDRVLGQYRMLALCTYSVDRCGASEVADVIRNHQFALIKRDGRWERFESFDRRRMQDALAAEREALRESEQRVRLKLESILSPGGDIGNLELADVLDGPGLQALMDELHKLVPVPMAVIDVRGKVLVGVGWQDVCTRFHRVHPDTARHCVESDTLLTADVPRGEFRLYRCKNNMWDVATPLFVGDQHVGNVFMGQFFFDDERPDRELFRAQAARYGFDEERYLAALDAVPRPSRETVAVGMAFFLRLSAMLSQLSYGNLHLARSIAEREELMRSLRESKERLEEADRRKNEFLGMLSHELRNPLAPIRNSIYILHHADPAGEQARRARAVIERQAEQLTRLVDDLLDVTRIARGKIELRRGRVDLGQIVRRAGEDHAGIMAELGIDLETSVPPEPVWADGDPVRLAQVVGNLLSNAQKFTPRGGRVALALEVVRGAAEIHVRDTGAGMEADLVCHVFEPFVQAERTLARTSGGLGLGLALVKGLAEMHGGSVRAASAGPGQGSEFVVRLPLEAEAGVAEGPGASRPARGVKSRRVLVIDDSRDTAESLAELVSMMGHTVEVAFDGPSALATARATRPDVVLCDIGLPGMSGYDVARALRAERATGLRMIAVSGYAQPDDVARAIDAGFDAHVAKPMDPRDIERMIA